MEQKRIKATKESTAIGLAVAHPELTDQEIAARVPCSRTSLYRMLGFRRVRAMIRNLGRAELPHGSKDRSRDGRQQSPVLEAWDDPCEEEE